ncbi:hypothetical protein WJX72_007974 [[Myrmecia] bisecta]|uniref:Uncharacterized protein n=1 Tax=[Myrmecia] bisecta TaxID=41462 RepID=A0AAW1PKI1_9CHLO
MGKASAQLRQSQRRSPVVQPQALSSSSWGDLWEKRGDLPVLALHAIDSVYQDWSFPTIMLVGNHDQVTAGGLEHAVRPIADACAAVHVMDRPTCFLDALWLPYRIDKVELVAAVAAAGPVKARFAHADVIGAFMNDSCQARDGLPPSLFQGRTPTYIGHYHKPHTVPGTSIHYIGSPYQVNRGEAGQDKRLVVLNKDWNLRPGDRVELKFGSEQEAAHSRLVQTLEQQGVEVRCSWPSRQVEARIADAEDLIPAQLLREYAAKEDLDDTVLSTGLRMLQEVGVPGQTRSPAIVIFQRVTLKGFGSFRDEAVYELHERGVRAVTGRNMDDEGTDSNGAGKSALMLAPLWALTGAAEGRLRIRRAQWTARRSKTGQSVRFWVGGRERTQGTPNLTNKEIAETLGSDLLCKAVFHGPAGTAALFKADDKQFKTELGSLVNWKVWQEAKDRANHQHTAAKRADDTLSRDIRQLDGNVEQLVMQVAERAMHMQAWQRGIDTEEMEPAAARRARTAALAEGKLQPKEDELREYKALVHSSAGHVDGHAAGVAAAQAAVEAERAAEAEIQLKETAERGRQATLLQERICSAEASLRQAKQCLFQPYVTRLLRSLNANSHPRSTSNPAGPPDVRTNTQDEDMHALCKEAGEVVQLCNSQACRHADLPQRIKALQSQQNPHSGAWELRKVDLQAAQAKRREAADQKEAKVQEQRAFKLLVEAFQPSGIPSFVLEQVLGELEQCTAGYLQQLSSGMTLELRATKTRAKASDGEMAVIDRVVYVQTAGHTRQQRTLVLLSSGEQRRIALALTLGFAKLIQMRGKISSNLIVVDEVMQCLDEEGCNRWDARPSFFTDDYILPQSAGWIIVLLFSAFFALVAWGLTWVDIKYGGAENNSEQFNTAGRTIKSGLIAVDIVSHWTWASILLQCVTYGYFYGASGAMFYATTGAVNVWLFCCMAIELKHKAPKAHTILEIIKLRWGKTAHVIFFFFAIFTNLLVTISMVQGAVSVTNTLCGVDVYALSFLIPLGIVVYSAVGGLKATFTTSYLHTIIILGVCVAFMFKVFGGPHGGGFDLLGSIDTIYERLIIVGQTFPIPGNKAGSYMTGFSQGALEVNIIFLISGFGQMFVDQAYWQSAVAASPTNAVKGYALASYIYFAIVFCLPLSMGLAALALNLPVNVDEALAGLVLPAAADAIIGKAGAIIIIIICFMAVTSSGAGELMAVASLITYDGYREYFRPKATSKELVRVSRCAILFWGLVAGAATSVINKAGINVNWMIIIIGVMVGAAVLPIVFALLWDKCTALAACTAACVGAACAISSWLAYAKIKYGEVTVATTGMNYPVLTGSLVSLGVSLILCVSLTYMFPAKEKFDWSIFANIKLADEKEHTGITQEGADSAAHIAKEERLGDPALFDDSAHAQMNFNPAFKAAEAEKGAVAV